MPVIIPRQKPNPSKPVNQVIIHPHTLVHHLHPCVYQVSISLIRWLLQESTIQQVEIAKQIFIITIILLPMLNIFIHRRMIIIRLHRIVIGHIQLRPISHRPLDHIWSIKPRQPHHRIQVHHRLNRIYRIKPMDLMLKCRKWWEIIHRIMNSILNIMPNTVKFSLKKKLFRCRLCVRVCVCVY